MRQKIGLGSLACRFLVASLFIFSVPIAHADDFTITPALIDAHGVPRDILSYSLTLTNDTGRQQIVFATVNELTADGKQAFTDPSISNRAQTLADWISVSRAATTFQPGESKTIPVGITINPFATEGDYHAVITFGEGATRAEAEQNLLGAPQAVIHVAVASDAREALQIDNFGPAKYFYSGFPVEFDYTIENTGDVATTPGGLVLFYDRVGHEIGSINANSSSVSIAPGAKTEFKGTWLSGPGLGQYKAVLSLTYGANDATIEKVALFWILPWQKLLIIFGTLFILIIVGAVLLHREYEKRHYRRRQFIEGLIKRPPTSIKPPSPPRAEGAGSVVDLRNHHGRDE